MYVAKSKAERPSKLTAEYMRARHDPEVLTGYSTRTYCPHSSAPRGVPRQEPRTVIAVRTGKPQFPSDKWKQTPAKKEQGKLVPLPPDAEDEIPMDIDAEGAGPDPFRSTESFPWSDIMDSVSWVPNP